MPRLEHKRIALTASLKQYQNFLRNGGNTLAICIKQYRVPIQQCHPVTRVTQIVTKHTISFAHMNLDPYPKFVRSHLDAENGTPSTPDTAQRYGRETTETLERSIAQDNNRLKTRKHECR